MSCKIDYIDHTEEDWELAALQELNSAFSHLLYHRTRQKLIVERLYTDIILGHLLEPELSSLHGEAFSDHDRGEKAFYNFIMTHSCNDLCKYFLSKLRWVIF